MEKRLAESWVNRDDHVVLGRRLHDYCLLDAFLLDLDENPIYARQRNVTLQDLQQAVLICSTPPDVFLRAKPALTRWQSTRWRWKLRKMDFIQELAKFMTYLADFDARPVFWKEESNSDGTSLKASWVLSVASFLESNTQMTEREIMTAPMGKVLWKAAAIAEQQGLSKDDIMTEEEETAMKEMGIEI